MLSAASSSAGIATEVHALEGFLIGEKEPVVESKPGVNAVAERDVAEFVGQSHGQGAFIGKDVQQAAADHDGVADGERFERRGQQHAASHVRNNLKIVGDDQVVDHGLQNLVHVALGREQSDFLQMIERVVFGRALPHALRFDRAGFLGGVGLVGDRINLDFGELSWSCFSGSGS